MPDLTIAIPIGPGHEKFAEKAKQSVREQTIEVTGLALGDPTGNGAGWTRNRLLAQVQTPYVAFLDSDDWIEPNFADIMLQAIRQADTKYVYSGWFEEYPPNGAKPVSPPVKCYCFDNDWQVHLVTAIVPTEWAKQVGGFDETLPGMEDTDFFHKLHEVGHCGLAINNPLIHYSYGGRRSLAFQKRPDYYEIKERIGKRYHKESMSCCGGTPIINSNPGNERQEGDVLAHALGSALVTVGRQSRRIYPRAGYGALLWVDPRDIDADPMRFKRSQQQEDLDRTREAFMPTHNGPVASGAADVAEIIEGARNKAFVPPTQGKPQGRKSITDLKKKAGY